MFNAPKPPKTPHAPAWASKLPKLGHEVFPRGHRTIRAVTFVSLVLLAFAFMFTGDSLPVITLGSTWTTCGFLFVPLIIAAFVFSPVTAALFGLALGGIVTLHVAAMPIEAYVGFFVSNECAFGVLPVAGALISAAFGLVVNKTAFRQPKRIAGMALVSLLAAALLPAALIYVGYLMAGFPLDSFEGFLIQLETTAGDPALHVALTTLAFLVFETLVDAAASWWAKSDSRPLGSVFGAWTLILIVDTFLILATASCLIMSARCQNRTKTILDNDCTITLEKLKAGTSEVKDFKGHSVGKGGGIIVAKNDVVESASDSSAIGQSFKQIVSMTFYEDYKDLVNSGQLLVAYNLFSSSATEATTRSFMVVKQSRAQDGTLYQVAAYMPDNEVYAERSEFLLWQLLSLGVIFMALYALIMTIVKKLVGESVRASNETLAQITAGNLDARLKIGGTREFHELSRGINTTVESLQSALDEVKESYEREMGIASAIQESVLPKVAGLMPEKHGLSVFANMSAARDVGGDFYDFFALGTPEDGPRRVAFVVADVSGKGVPAALFMMAAKAEIKNRLLSGLPLDEAIDEANQRLCADADGRMFVTTFACVLDCATGVLECVNAGHNPPLLRKGGTWDYLRNRSGVFLGSFEDASFMPFTVTLEPGDALLLYTDGVTEAVSATGEFWGEERLLACVQERADAEPSELGGAVERAVFDWEEGCEQSDDVTVLAVRYEVSENGKREEATTMDGNKTASTEAVHRLGTMHLEVPATSESLSHTLEVIEHHLQMSGCPDQARNQIAVCVEELFVNVASYAYEDGTAIEKRTVELQMESGPTKGGRHASTLTVTDAGRPFDPLGVSDPTLPSSIEDAGIGGLGIFMAKQIADEINYERKGDLNVLTLVKYW